jgi:hypothetical protein
MNVLLIVLGIIIVVLGYVLYMSFQSAPSIKLLELKDATKVKAAYISTATFPQVGTSTRFAYGVWIYANQLGNATGKQQQIFYTLAAGALGDPTSTKDYTTSNSGAGNPNYTFVVYLEPTTPTLHCGICTAADKTNVAETSCPTGSAACKSTFDVKITDNFTLQRWVYLVISVDNQFVDLYLDGKLVKSVKMNNTTYQDTANVVSTTITTTQAKTMAAVNFGCIDGVILANFQRWETPLDPQSVWNYYMRGNGQSGNLTNYNVNLDFVKNNVLTTQWKLL